MGFKVFIRGSEAQCSFSVRCRNTGAQISAGSLDECHERFLCLTARHFQMRDAKAGDSVFLKVGAQTCARALL